MAKVLNLKVDQPPQESDMVFEDINAEQTLPLRLPFISSLLKLVKDSWEKPTTMDQIPWRAENFYRIHGEDTNFLTRHPLPNSFVVKATQNKARIQSTSTPSNREGRKIDTIGRRGYSLAAFVLRVSNYMAAMGSLPMPSLEQNSSISE